jgi:hypothetical protein
MTVAITGFTQDKFRASLSMGPSYPIGKFSSTDLSSKSAGYAQSGFALTIDGDYYLHNRVAVTLLFHFGNSPIDQSAFSERLIHELAGYVTATDSVQFDINYWQWASPMVGLKYNYPIILNKFYFEVGAFTGMNFVQIPDQNLFFSDDKNKRIIVSQNVGSTDITFPVALSAGFRYRINPKMQFKLNAQYFNTNTSFEHVSYYQLENNIEKVEIEKYNISVPIQTLNVSAGLVYNF